MRYENQEKLKKAAQDKKELDHNIMKEYCLAESFEEFMLKCAVKYGWGPKNVFNKYWWHYKITDVGKKRFFNRLLIAGIFIPGSSLLLLLLTVNTYSPISMSFVMFSAALTVFLPFIINDGLGGIYSDFNNKLCKINDELNDKDDDNLSSCHFNLSS